MLTVIARIRVQPGREAVAETALREMVEYVTRAEPGTLRYLVHRGRNTPTEFVVYEQYADQAAFDAHGSSEAIQRLFGAIGPVLDGEPSIEFYDVLASKE